MVKNNLQWTNPFFTTNTAAIPELSQVIERRIGLEGLWEAIVATITPDDVEPSIYKASDETVVQEENIVSYFYRIVTKNKSYTVNGNEIEIEVPATIPPVEDLTGTFEPPPEA